MSGILHTYSTVLLRGDLCAVIQLLEIQPDEKYLQDMNRMISRLGALVVS